MENYKFVVLVSNSFATSKQLANQNRALHILESRRFPVDVVDGSDVSSKECRDSLFRISGVRGQYPQIFLADTDGRATFVGNFDIVEEINEASSLPEEVLEAYPSILTWNKLLNSDGVHV